MKQNRPNRDGVYADKGFSTFITSKRMKADFEMATKPQNCDQYPSKLCGEVTVKTTNTGPIQKADATKDKREAGKDPRNWNKPEKP